MLSVQTFYKHSSLILDAPLISFFSLDLIVLSEQKKFNPHASATINKQCYNMYFFLNHIIGVCRS